jgi:hypothetical protein
MRSIYFLKSIGGGKSQNIRKTLASQGHLLPEKGTSQNMETTQVSNRHLQTGEHRRRDKLGHGNTKQIRRTCILETTEGQVRKQKQTGQARALTAWA